MGLTTSIAVSGLIVTSLKLANSANNIANSETKGYQAKDVDGVSQGFGVRPVFITRPLNPISPDIPNVNLEEELITAEVAARSYEANAILIRTDKDLQETLLSAVADED